MFRKKGLITAPWFPDCTNDAILDQLYDDFDAQSERLSGHDQLYYQLSPGQFLGRFASGFMGADVSVHIEAASQALEQIVTGQIGGTTLGLVLSEAPGFTINGQEINRDTVFLMSARAELNVTSPPGGVVLAVVLSEAALAQAGASDTLLDELLSSRPEIAVYAHPPLASSLRRAVFAALDRLSAASGAPQDARATGAALANSLCALMELCEIGASRLSPAAGQALVHRARKAVLADAACWLDTQALAHELGCSPRNVQTLFARYGQITPSEYLRRVRLNRARRAFLQPGRQAQSIGDVAARYGFWNWSRFSANYAALFGELPSQTRQRSPQA